MTGTYIGKTYKEYQREFVEHFPYGKQIGEILDTKKCKNVTGPQNRFSWVWNLKNLETRFQLLRFLKNILKLLMKFLCRMDHTLFQTSSRGSGLKQNRFGDKFRNTVKNTHKLNVALTF